MKFSSPVFAQASGSIGGQVYSHNKGGMYTRNRTTPTNPSTPAQVAVRSNFSTLAKRWTNVLINSQRTAWETYAANVPLLNTLGASRPIPGLAMYQRCNGVIMNAGGAIVDDGPTTYTLATFGTTSWAVVGATGVLTFNFDPTDDWANEDNGLMVLQASTAQTGATNFFKGPFTTTGVITGSAMTPPTTPVLITIPHPIAVRNRIFLRVQVARADGRIATAEITVHEAT